MNQETRLPPKPGDRELDRPPSGVQICLIGPAPSTLKGNHWSECIVLDPRPTEGGAA